MKTPKEWLAHIKQASDSEVRHGSTVFLTEEDVRAMLLDGWRQGMEDAASVCGKGLCRANIYAKLTHPPIRLENS